MKRKLLSGIALLVMIITACNNPFFPERIEKLLTSPVNKAAGDDGLVITVDGSGKSEVDCIEGEEITLTVDMDDDEDNYTFQWFENDENSNEGGKPISGATNPTFNPPTDEEGETYYYVVIKNKKTGKETTSKPIKVTISKERFVVTFNSNGGSSVSDISVTPNTAVSHPANPAKSGYVFDYWYQDSGLTTPYNFNAPVTANITLYARWVSVAIILQEIANNMTTIIDGTGQTFIMGSPSTELGSSDNERPQHSVTLSSFKMSKYQVTQEQWEAVMGTNPSYYHGGMGREPAEGEIQSKRPVESVSWYDALVFCNKLSVIEGLSPAYSISGSTDPAVWGTVPTSSNTTWNAVVIVDGSTGYRLPTEAQWEYACRAGTTTAYNTGDTISDNTGWYKENSGNKTHEVGKKPANAFGLYDMHGNVMERCWDGYNSRYYNNSPPANDPMGESSGVRRSTRGGHFNSSAASLRSAFRTDDDTGPNYRNNALGFRLARP